MRPPPTHPNAQSKPIKLSARGLWRLCYPQSHPVALSLATSLLYERIILSAPFVPYTLKIRSQEAFLMMSRRILGGLRSDIFSSDAPFKK